MADTGIFCTTAEVVRKAGAGAPTTSTAEAYVNDFVMQAESYINLVSRKNWSDVYVSANTDLKGVLKEAASSLAAVYVINYDTSNFSSLKEAEDRIEVLLHRVDRCIEILQDQKNVTFVGV